RLQDPLDVRLQGVEHRAELPVPLVLERRLEQLGPPIRPVLGQIPRPDHPPELAALLLAVVLGQYDAHRALALVAPRAERHDDGHAPRGYQPPAALSKFAGGEPLQRT